MPKCMLQRESPAALRQKRGVQPCPLPERSSRAGVAWHAVRSRDRGYPGRPGPVPSPCTWGLGYFLGVSHFGTNVVCLLLIIAFQRTWVLRKEFQPKWVWLSG